MKFRLPQEAKSQEETEESNDPEGLPGIVTEREVRTVDPEEAGSSLSIWEQGLKSVQVELQRITTQTSRDNLM